MNPDILACDTGGRETINADFASHWTIQNGLGHFYIVCDGIGHDENTAAAVAEFCELLKIELAKIAIHNVSALKRAIIDTIALLELHRETFAFCMTAALTVHEQILVAHCGDCRLGFLTSQGVDWKTKDDVPYLDLYRNGTVNKDMYLTCRHFVSCKVQKHFNSENLKLFTLANSSHQKMLLCTDGFWSYWEDNYPNNPVLTLSILGSMVPELTHNAPDNFSVILV